MFKVKRLHEDSVTPTKAHEDDSGWDMYAYDFKELHQGPAPEHKLVPDPETGMIPGCQSSKGSLTLNPMERVVIGTGIAGFVDFPEDVFHLPYGAKVLVELQARPRSGNRRKEGLEVHLGTVDKPYRGEICVIVTNLGHDAREIRVGDRIAQLVPTLVLKTTLKVVGELDGTVRGSSGFGDSGKR